jgi:hypothetical protein
VEVVTVISQIPEIEDVFKYLDGLQAVNTTPEQYVNRLAKRFNLPVDDAEYYITVWVDKDYKDKFADIEQRYRDHLAELALDHHKQIEDLEQWKANKLEKHLKPSPSRTD